jgi:hypothetical protein
VYLVLLCSQKHLPGILWPPASIWTWMSLFEFPYHYPSYTTQDGEESN